MELQPSTLCANVFLLVYAFSTAVFAAVDLTIVDSAVGVDVVLATIAKIEATRAFTSDKRLLHRIAYVETTEGESLQSPATDGNNGGIWKVNRGDFELTKQDKSLAKKRLDVAAVFPEIEEWELVQWEDLNKPLWSALAARLVVLQAKLNNLTDIPAPSDVSGQATFWNDYYNKEGNTSLFQMAVQILNNLYNCRVKMDLIFILDGSGSVGTSNFDKVRDFVSGFVNELEIGANRTQVGIIRYSTSAEVVFHLNKHHIKSTLLEAIDNIPYTGGFTNTADALCLLLEEGYTEEKGARLSADDVFQITVVMTDGQSNRNSDRCDFNTFEAAEAIHNASYPILVFAVGVTSGVNENELTAIATREDYITHLTDFNPYTFQETSDEQTYEICTKGTIAKDVGIQLQGSLEHGGKIRYEFEMPLEGMTVNLCVSEGQVHLYSSFLLPNPNSALYDYKCKAHAVDNSLCDDVFIPKNSASTSTTQKVYTSLEGIGEHMSDYLLLTLIGDQTSHEDHLYVETVGGWHNGSIEQDRKIYYAFSPVSLIGVTIQLCVKEGYIVIYGSFRVSTPNSTMHDCVYKVNSDTCIEFFLSPAEHADTLHITLEGNGDFTMISSSGDTTMASYNHPDDSTPGPDEDDGSNPSGNPDIRVAVITRVIPLCLGALVNLLMILLMCVLLVYAFKKRKNKVGVTDDSNPLAQSRKQSAYYYIHEPTE